MYTVTPRQRKDGRWHWSAVARNGKIVFSGAEGDGFASKRGAMDNYWRVVNAFFWGKVTTKNPFDLLRDLQSTTEPLE